MTIAVQTQKVSFTGNGVTTDFPYTFWSGGASNLRVIVTDTDNVETVITDYTVADNNNETGGTVTLPTALPSGHRLTIKRVLPLVQSTDYENNSAFHAETHERALDYSIAVTQQLNETLKRTPKFAESSLQNDVTIPDLVANKALKVNAAGDGLEWSTDDFNTIVQDATAQAVIATTQAGIATTQAATATTQATNASNSAALAEQWATSLSLVDATNYGAKKYALDAAGYAAALNLPALGAGTATKFLRVASTEDGYELRSAAQVLGDIGAADTAHTHTGVYEPANANIAKINTAQTFTASQRGTITTLTDGATITPNFAVTNDFVVTLGGNRTIANPSNMVAGQKGVIVIKQDATGGRTVAWGTYFKWTGGVAPTLSTSANAVDRVHYHVVSATEIHCQWVGDFK